MNLPSASASAMTRALWLCASLLGCWLLALPAFAAPSATDGASSPRAQFGVIWRIKGEVVAKEGENSRPLQSGSPVYVGEHIRTAATGEAVIKTGDAGLIAVRPNAEFVATNFLAEGKKTDGMTLKLLTGSLRIITGWIGKLNPHDHRVITPNATIGIRGTDHEPYVLSAELAAATPYKEGTYDKVNRGRTALGEGEQSLEIEAGRVGFARKSPFETKGLMTILMPVLLDKVPDFYVPGQFDAELDQLTQTADAESARQLAQKRQAGHCAPASIARGWLQQFDRAVAKRNAPAILSLFAPDVKVQATVRTRDGASTMVEFDRDELAQSTVAAAKGLKHYHQRRLTVDATQVPTAQTCEQISVRSAVIEQGVQSGKPYRLEADEEYLLELRDGKWLATKAATTQK